jgi:hypothetical protein
MSFAVIYETLAARFKTSAVWRAAHVSDADF